MDSVTTCFLIRNHLVGDPEQAPH